MGLHYLYVQLEEADMLYVREVDANSDVMQ